MVTFDKKFSNNKKIVMTKNIYYDIIKMEVVYEKENDYF